MILRLFGGLKRHCAVKHYVRHLKVAQNFVLRCGRMPTNDPIKLWTDTQFHRRNMIVMSEILYFDVWTSNLPSDVRSQDSPKVHPNVRMPANDRIKLKVFIATHFYPRIRMVMSES